jgi:putative FmdB family regulatory protein
MPTYIYKCDSCGTFEKVSSMKEHKNYAFCKCNRMAFQVITKPMLIIPKEISYLSPVDGTPITNKKERSEDLARNGCVEYDPCMKQDADRRIRESDKAVDDAIDQAVHEGIASFSAEKQAQLALDVEKYDLAVTR